MIICDGQIQRNGFGNEFFRVAKALICSREFNLTLLKPHWPDTYALAIPDTLQEPQKFKTWIKRKYYGLTHKTVAFTEEEHLASGIVPVEKAFYTFLKRNGITFKDNVRVTFPALYPGLECIEKHGKYLKETLLENKWLAKCVREHVKTLPLSRLLVGVHIRRGDFRKQMPLGEPWPKNVWNIGIPFEWYGGICHKLLQAFPDKIEFVVFSDSVEEELNHLTMEFPIYHLITKEERGPVDIVDMLMLSMCDIIVSSVSWFSGWAVVFSDSPFLWYPCAHGRPGWGADRCYEYVSEENLPEGLLLQAQKLLAYK